MINKLFINLKYYKFRYKMFPFIYTESDRNIFRFLKMNKTDIIEVLKKVII